jgi:hypothetical protein
VTPYDPNDLFEIQFVQDAQYMRLVHPDYQPYKMTRTGHAAWTLTAITFSNGPFIDQNDDDTWTLTADATSGAGVNLVSTDDLFDADHVGAMFQISHILEATNVSGSFGSIAAQNYYSQDPNGAAGATTDWSPSVFIQEGRIWDFHTHGRWAGTIKVRKTYDGTTWVDTDAFYTAEADGNFQFTGEELEKGGARYRVYFVPAISFGECRFNLTARAFTNRGVITITTVTDATNAIGTVDGDYLIGSTDATWRWAEGAWSDYRGWPRTIEHHEQRCIYGGSTSFPQTIWASTISLEDEDYDDFSAGQGDTDSDAWTYILPGMNPIQWMKSDEYLMIGTTAGIGRLGQPEKPITPTFPPTYRLQAKVGSAYIQAKTAIDAILYVERGARKVREVNYSSLSERYIAPDMTILAEHLTDANAITSMEFQSRPDPILWCIRNDGTLLSFTYNRHHDVLSWSRHDTGASGQFESVAKMPGVTEDEIWLVAKRTVNSSDVRYIEQLASLTFPAYQNDCVFVDSYVTSITNLSHLEGEDVALFADGRPVAGTFTVSSGAISPTDSYTNYIVGLPYTSVLETLPLVSYNNQGPSKAKYVAVTGVALDLYKTLAVSIGTSSSYLSDIQISYDSFATTSEAFTGLKRASFPRGPFLEPTIYFSVDEPAPFTLRGLTADMTITYP